MKSLLSHIENVPVEQRERIERAMWEGDTDTLNELAPCRCCCHEHTFESCPARVWQGCRGQGTLTRAEEVIWEEHYAKFHGLSWEKFHGYGE